MLCGRMRSHALRLSLAVKLDIMLEAPCTELIYYIIIIVIFDYY